MIGMNNDGEEEILEQVLLSNPPGVSPEFQEPITASDSFLLDQFLRNTQTCTHTHTCNPPGPDAIHTHTCYHTHTQVFASEDDDGMLEKQKDSGLKSRRPSGNREAVRKYREKKKAHTAYLEEEVKKLRWLNQQLIKRLQSHAMLEDEVLRLRSLLVDLRGKIDTELDIFPFQKQCFSAFSLKEENFRVEPVSEGGNGILQCETTAPCLHPQSGSSAQIGIGGSTVMTWARNCELPIAACLGTVNGSSGQSPGPSRHVVEANLINGLVSKAIDTDGTLATSASQTA